MQHCWCHLRVVLPQLDQLWVGLLSCDLSQIRLDWLHHTCWSHNFDLVTTSSRLKSIFLSFFFFPKLHLAAYKEAQSTFILLCQYPMCKLQTSQFHMDWSLCQSSPHKECSPWDDHQNAWYNPSSMPFQCIPQVSDDPLPPSPTACKKIPMAQLWLGMM